MKIFVVMGTSGDHSEREEWAVCAYSSERLAQAHVEAASAREREIDVQYHDRWWKADEHGKDTDNIKRGRNELDPRAPTNREPARYFLHAIDLDLPTFTQKMLDLVQQARREGARSGGAD